MSQRLISADDHVDLARATVKGRPAAIRHAISPSFEKIHIQETGVMRSSGVDVLRSALGAAGVSAVYGEKFAGVGVEVGSRQLAVLIALADERAHGGLAAAHVGGQVLHFGTGSPQRVLAARDVVEIPDAVATVAGWRRDDPTTTVALRLDLDFDRATEEPVHAAPALPSGPAPWIPPADEVVDRLQAADRLMFLVGPGVLRSGCEGGLRTLAAVTSAGVLNTWGAKGVFFWQSRHHLATIGLQADDYVLGGLGDADVVLVSGIDQRESPRSRWDHLAPSIDVPPQMLAALSELVLRPRRHIAFPELRTRLVAATGWGYESTSPVPAPSALTRQYSRLVGPSGLVAADPGTAGFFVARTLPTEAPWTICVPAESDVSDVAVAACVAARLRNPTRRCVAVIDGPPRDQTAELLEVATRLGVSVVVESWEEDGEVRPAPEHFDQTAAALASSSNTVRRIAVDPTQLEQFEAAAGPVTAWV